MAIKPWTVLDSRYIAETPWINLRADRCETAEGDVVDEYYVVECPDWVHILAFDEDRKVLVTRQYRHGNRRISLEFPCGEVDRDDATPLDAARRELLEETGFEAGEWIDGGVLHANPARQSNRIHTFVARRLKHVRAPKCDPLEKIECEFLALDEIHSRIEGGEFTHALHVAALHLALRALG